MKKLFYLCVEGNVLKTYENLKNTKDKSEEKSVMEMRYNNRFFKENPDYHFFHEDKWIENVVNSYRHYFVDVLTKKVELLVAETRLLETLNDLLPSDKKGLDMSTAEENLKAIFNEKNYFFLGGRVLPHYGPFIWKKSDKKMHHVELLDTTEEVQVNFLDDFLMLSWLHFATFGEVYAGGWAEKDALYCILPNYRDKLETDPFLVSFLKHEAQHYNDYKQFPKLTGADLEYRAKLTELYFYSNYDFLEKLLVQAVNIPNPHNYSAFIILERFSNHFFSTEVEKQLEKWKGINYEELRAFAKILFDEHTYTLRSTGANTVEGII